MPLLQLHHPAAPNSVLSKNEPAIACQPAAPSRVAPSSNSQTTVAGSCCPSFRSPDVAGLRRLALRRPPLWLQAWLPSLRLRSVLMPSPEDRAICVSSLQHPCRSPCSALVFSATLAKTDGHLTNIKVRSNRTLCVMYCLAVRTA